MNQIREILNIIMIFNIVLVTAIPNFYNSGVKFLKPVISIQKALGVTLYILVIIHCILGLMYINFSFKEEVISAFISLSSMIVIIYISNKNGNNKHIIEKFIYIAIGALLIHIAFVSKIGLFIIIGITLIIISIIVLYFKNKQSGLNKLKYLFIGILINYIFFFMLINAFSTT